MPFCTMDWSGFNIPYSSGSPRTIIQEFRSRYSPREQFDERHEWWIQQYVDTDGKLLKKGLTFPYSATDLLAIFHALADGHQIKEDMKNHFLTVVKHVDRYPTVIVPMTDQEILEVPRGHFALEVDFKWNSTKVFPEVITDLGLPFVAIRHLNPNDQVKVSQSPLVVRSLNNDADPEELRFAFLATRKLLAYEIYHRNYKGSRKIDDNHIPTLPGITRWSERTLFDTLLPQPVGKKSFACCYGLYDIYSACMLVEALASQNQDACGKDSIPHTRVFNGSALVKYTRMDGDWNLNQYHATLAKIGKADHPQRIDLILYEHLLLMIREERERYIYWNYPRGRAPEFTDLYNPAVEVEVEDE